MAQPASAENVAAMQESFFGRAPSIILDDMYVMREDYIADGVDAFERQATKLMEDLASRKAARLKKNKAQSAYNAAADEIAKGADAMLGVMMEALELSGDMFDVFALRNAFRWPAGLKYEGPGAGSGHRLYTAEEEAAADDRIAQLEAAVVFEQRKRRILSKLAAHMGKRVPQAEEAAAALEEAARQLETASQAVAGDVGSSASSSSSSSGELGGLSSHLSQVARLTRLLDELQGKSPEAAAAIRRMSDAHGMAASAGQARPGGAGAMDVEGHGHGAGALGRGGAGAVGASFDVDSRAAGMGMAEVEGMQGVLGAQAGPGR